MKHHTKILILVLLPLFSFSQEKKDYFLLENNHTEYSYTISENEKKITLFSKKNDFIISFEIENKKECFINIKNYRSYRWIINNLTILHKEKKENVLELNTFKGMIFALKFRNKFFTYTVKRRIIEEYD